MTPSGVMNDMIKTEKIPGRQRNRSIKDHTGIKYGRLTAVSLIERRADRCHRWLFKCDCGNVVALAVNRVATGKTKSCGCILSEFNRKKNTTHGLSRLHKREYRSWKDMRARCRNPNNTDYHLYGGRGISICPTWDSFAQFVSDMGPRPAGYTLDRIDVNGGYGKDNCRWATDKQQANNKRTNVYIEIEGTTRTLQEWSDYFGVDRSKARYRMNQGWPIEDVFRDKDFRIPAR